MASPARGRLTKVAHRLVARAEQGGDEAVDIAIDRPWRRRERLEPPVAHEGLGKSILAEPAKQASGTPK